MNALLENSSVRSADIDRRRDQPLVLVTDDHADTRLLFSTILAMHGCAVIEAADGEEAVQLAKTSQPDLILMDGYLPRLDGLAATRQIRDHDNGRHTPIILICGRAEPSFRASAFAAGCDDFFLKPMSIDVFGSVIEKHLGRPQESLQYGRDQ